MNEPDFLVVGAMKAGTTQFVDYLTQSDDIHIPLKEINYFDGKRKISYEDYLKEFSSNDNLKKGEKTTAYSYVESAPQKIFSKLPNVKIIWVLRNPIDRAYSNYWHAVKSGKEKSSFETCIMEDEKRYKNNIFTAYLSRSIYVTQIKRYLKNFDIDQMHFVVAENLKKNPQKEINCVCEFLDVPKFNLLNLNRFANVTFLPRSIWLEYYSRYLFGATLIYRIIHYINKKPTPGYPNMKEETRDKLLSYFAPYNVELAKLIDINHEVWNK